MIELRWLERVIYESAIEPGNIIKVVRVLQYRLRANPLETGLQEAIWSDWQDVPTVREE